MFSFNETFNHNVDNLINVKTFLSNRFRVGVYNSAIFPKYRRMTVVSKYVGARGTSYDTNF